jgi:heme/copper-type cytochrome/quinol oxidase subunit 4
MKKVIITGGIAIAGAASAFAQTSGGTSAIGQSLINLITLAQQIINLAGPLLIGVAVVSLFVGMVMFLWKGRDGEKEHEKWLKFMGMSILALFVMVSIWGLVGFIGGILGINQGGRVPVPALPAGQNVYNPQQ